jgi:Uma2 family endonuclease
MPTAVLPIPNTKLETEINPSLEFDPSIVSPVSQIAPNKMSLEEFLLNPPENSEWVNEQIIAKANMGIFHGKTQAEFAALLIAFAKSNRLTGIVCTEVICRTLKQARKPDVAYISPQQVELYGKSDFTVLPECFPMVIEIVSPRDMAEDVFSKAEEYLEGGAEEV